MAFRQLPRREVKLSRLYADAGGVREYVFAQIDAGEKIETISDELTGRLGERVPVDTLYAWIRRWRQDAEQNERREVMTA